MFRDVLIRRSSSPSLGQETYHSLLKVEVVPEAQELWALILHDWVELERAMEFSWVVRPHTITVSRNLISACREQASLLSGGPWKLGIGSNPRARAL